MHERLNTFREFLRQPQAEAIGLISWLELDGAPEPVPVPNIAGITPFANGTPRGTTPLLGQHTAEVLREPRLHGGRHRLADRTQDRHPGVGVMPIGGPALKSSLELKAKSRSAGQPKPSNSLTDRGNAHAPDHARARLAGFAILAAATVASAQGSAQEPKRGGMLNFAVVAEPPNYDCHANTTFGVHPPGRARTTRRCSNTRATGRPCASSPTSPSWSSAPDGLTFTFKLRQREVPRRHADDLGRREGQLRPHHQSARLACCRH